MSFPTRSRREEDLCSVCLFRGVQKGASSLIIFFSWSLWMSSQSSPPAYSCGRVARALHLNEAAQTAAPGAPQWGGQAWVSSPSAAAPAGTPPAQGANSGHRKSAPRFMPSRSACSWMAAQCGRRDNDWRCCQQVKKKCLLLLSGSGYFSRSHKATIYGTCFIIISSGNLGREGRKREAGGGAKGSDSMFSLTKGDLRTALGASAFKASTLQLLFTWHPTSVN